MSRSSRSPLASRTRALVNLFHLRYYSASPPLPTRVAQESPPPPPRTAQPPQRADVMCIEVADNDGTSGEEDEGWMVHYIVLSALSHPSFLPLLLQTAFLTGHHSHNLEVDGWERGWMDMEASPSSVATSRSITRNEDRLTWKRSG